MVKFLKRAVWFSLKKIGLLPRFLRLRMRKRVIKVPIDELRCQEKSFYELQGFSGRTIDHFPPCRFFELGLTDPEKAYDAHCRWLRKWLLDMQAWKIHPSEGGWAKSSLARTVFQVHQEHGIVLTDLEQADPTLIDEAIGRRARYYLDLFDSIKEKGYIRSLYPPVYCRAKDGLYMIQNGHHRVAALWVLGYQEVDVEILR